MNTSGHSSVFLLHSKQKQQEVLMEGKQMKYSTHTHTHTQTLEYIYIHTLKHQYMLQYGLTFKMCYIKETSQKSSCVQWFHLYKLSRRGKFAKTESR